MKPELIAHRELVKGEPRTIHKRHLIPIYRIDAMTVGGAGQLVWAEADPKGVVIVEKVRSWYVPIDGEQMQVSTLVEMIPGLKALLNELKNK